MLSSRKRLTVNEWVKVVASKRGQEGTLVVNDEEPVKGEIILVITCDKNDKFSPYIYRFCPSDCTVIIAILLYPLSMQGEFVPNT